MNALESKFLEYQATPDDEFPAYFDEDDKPMRIDHIWHQISKQIDLYSGHPRIKHFVEFAKFLLLIPHSNSYCWGGAFKKYVRSKFPIVDPLPPPCSPLLVLHVFCKFTCIL